GDDVRLGGLLGNGVQLQPRRIATQLLLQLVEAGIAEVAQESSHRHRADADPLAHRRRRLERNAADVVQQVGGDFLLRRRERLPAALQFFLKVLGHCLLTLPLQESRPLTHAFPHARDDGSPPAAAAPRHRQPPRRARRTSHAQARSTAYPARRRTGCRKSRRRTRWRCWSRESPPVPSARTGPGRPAGCTTRRWSSARTTPPATTSWPARHVPRSIRPRSRAAHRKRRPPRRQTPSCPATGFPRRFWPGASSAPPAAA